MLQFTAAKEVEGLEFSIGDESLAFNTLQFRAIGNVYGFQVRTEIEHFAK